MVENDESSKTVQLTRDLVSAAPAHARGDLSTLLEVAEKSRATFLVEIVAACCRVVEDCRMSPVMSWKFAEAAWNLVSFVMNSTLGPARLRVNSVAASRPGEILRVPAKTHLMIGLILSRSPDPRQVLLNTSRGPISRYDLGRAVQFAHFLEYGGSADSRLFQLESLLWNRLFPSETAYTVDHRQDLRGWLEEDRLEGQPNFVVVDPGTGSSWKELAASVSEVTFVEPEEDVVFPDEDKLAYLVGDLIELTGCGRRA